MTPGGEEGGMPKRILSLLMVAALVAGPLVQRAEAGRDKFPPVIRDAEIEKTLREYTTPIFQVAGLDPTAVHIFLLQSDQINAFVAGGMNVFIYTGLLVRTQRPGQLIGVVAHETGHIAGGHLVRLQQAMNDAPLEMIISAVLSGGILLRYTRTMEASADAAALTFLDRLHQSARGMMEFLQILQRQEFVLVGQLNPYLINHPLTSDRIDNVRQHVEQSPYGNVPDPPAWVDQHNRMIAKLVGFLWPFQQVLIKYPESDKSLYGRYARAIAYFRAGDLVHSLALIDQLIAENPMDPYFPEQKGQILFENGRGAEALTAYQRALDLAPDEPLIRMELANVQIEQESPGLLKPAIQELKVVVRQEPHNSDAWRLLGIAFGRDGQIGKASWALAEGAALRGDDKQARHLADEAMKQLPMGSPEWLRSQDIFSAPKPTKDESSGGISG
jgi:predicted Zn-dependent protease